MGVVQIDASVAESLSDAVRCRLHFCASLGAKRQLGLVFFGFAIDGEAGTVRPTVGKRCQHAFSQFAKLWLQGGILEKQANYAAHGRKLRKSSPSPCYGKKALVNLHEIIFPTRKAAGDRENPLVPLHH